MAPPMYLMIADDLREQIESGALASGERLHAEPNLCDQYGASRNTVRDAIKMLISRGLVETRPGQGTFVAQKIDPYVSTLSGNPEGSEVISRHEKRYIDGTPWSMQTSFYPTGFGKSYLRGELSGSLTLIGGITTNKITIKAEPNYTLWDLDVGSTVRYVRERLHLPINEFTWPHATLHSPLGQTNEHCRNDSIPTTVSRLRQNETQIFIRSTEALAQLQAMALEGLLAAIWIVFVAATLAIHSIFRFARATTTIIKTLMSHRNTREPAYFPISRLPIYQSLAGVALTH